MEGLDEYVTDSDGLTDSVLVSLQNQAEDVLNAYIAKSWDSECVTLKGMSYLGYYILTPKLQVFRRLSGCYHPALSGDLA